MVHIRLQKLVPHLRGVEEDAVWCSWPENPKPLNRQLLNPDCLKNASQSKASLGLWRLCVLNTSMSAVS